MFTPAPLRQLNIFVLEEDIGEVTATLARLNVLDLSENKSRGVWSDSQTETWAELAETYTDIERRTGSLLDILDISRDNFDPPERLLPKSDALHLEQFLKEVEPNIKDWQDRKTETEEKVEHLQSLIQQMEWLETLDVSIEEIRSVGYLHLVLGTMPKENLERLRIALFRVPFVIVPIYEYEQEVLLFAATDRDHAEVLNRTLDSAFLEPLALPEDISGAPTEALAKLKSRLTEATGTLNELERKRETLIEQWEQQLVRLWSQASSNVAITNTVNRLARHQDVFLITGWVPAADLDEVLRIIEQTTDGRADVDVLDPGVGDRLQAPTLIQNPAFLRPFETIVSTFGFPSYSELDPTPIVALTFILMYGMMFGDVGHGLLLALAGLWLWRSQQGMAASIGVVLAVSGLSAMLFGFLYGSLFGYEDILPQLWLSPLDSIQNILLASVAAGIGLLNIGFLLHLIVTGRARAWGSFLFSQSGLAGIWLYWALLGGALALWWGMSLPLGLWLLLVVIPAALVFLHEPLTRLVRREQFAPEEGWGAYSIESFFELFETFISHISNSLSFVRLGAFAVAHAGLSQVILSLAGVAGGLWQWPIILMGTLLIVAFEGLIVGIQALRLNYYEFFGKFFDGRGRVFQPLRLSQEAEQALTSASQQ